MNITEGLHLNTKVDKINKTHRAIFIGGKNFRDGNTSINVDVNVGNYPIDVEDTDTNNGFSWKQHKGIPNMTLKGNTFKEKMPILMIFITPLISKTQKYKNIKKVNMIENQILECF